MTSLTPSRPVHHQFTSLDLPILPIHAKSSKQFRTHKICLALNQHRIRNIVELNGNLKTIIKKICGCPFVFKNFAPVKCFEFFASAVRSYEAANDVTIRLKDSDRLHFYEVLASTRTSAPKLITKPFMQDLERITKNYDRLETAFEKLMKNSSKLAEILRNNEYVVVPKVIFGIGDAGTTLWLEKYASYHKKTGNHLRDGNLPHVLIIAQNLGNMRQNYALSQTHNMFERGEAPSNPNDYISEESYQTNQYLNARHLYQSNVVNLAKTDAPIMLGTILIGIEKRENHLSDWHSHMQSYRLRIVTSSFQEKLIYIDQLDVCTGLGYARKEFLKHQIDSSKLQELSQFDPEKHFHPIIDGDQYIFNFSEDKSENQIKKTVVIFGGGDTSAAAYRKAYFGRDFCLKKYSEKDCKNHVFWFSSHGFERAGKGKMPQEAIENAKERGALFNGKLRSICYDSKAGRLSIYFNLDRETIVKNQMDQFEKVPGPHIWIQEGVESFEDEWFKIECDQFIYSIGQESEDRRNLCSQIKSDLELDLLKDELIPLGIRTKDDKIHFFGAAAQTMGGKIYADAMLKWISKTNINEDSSAPAVLPPSRAVIKMHAVSQGARVHTVNVNVDDPCLIRKLLNAAKVGSVIGEAFINDILANRRRTSFGMRTEHLQELLKVHRLNEYLCIKGLALLCQKEE